MDNLIFIIIICIGIPLALALVFLEKRSRLFIIFMIIGAYMCAFASQANTFLRDLIGESFFYITTNITPITEEVLKALPVLIYAATFKNSKKVLLPISMAIGIGFAIIENIYIFTQNGANLGIFWAIQRVFGASLMHGLCTATVGYGISFVRMKRKLFYTGTFALLVVAMVYHSAYNTLVQSNFSSVAFLLPLLTYVILAVQYWSKNKEVIREKIREKDSVNPKV